MNINESLLQEIADEYGTPFFIYNESLLKQQCDILLRNIGKSEIFYSMKANPNPSVCDAMKRLGLGIEVASIGEMELALKIGFDKDNIFFTAPSKSKKELKMAIENNILAINVDNWQELEVIEALAEQYQKEVSITFRIHQDLASLPKRGLKMTGDSVQFGVTSDEIINEFEKRNISTYVKCIGLHTFQGSENFNVGIYEQSWRELIELIRFLEDKGHNINLVGLGGGFGYDPTNKKVFDFEEFREILTEFKTNNPILDGKRIFFESGTFLTRCTGKYCTRVMYTKQRKENYFIFVDGGTHHIQGDTRFSRMFNNYKKCTVIPKRELDVEKKCTIVGKLCTPNDILSYKKSIGKIEPEDLIIFSNCGAYELSSSRQKFLSHREPSEVFLTSHGTLKSVQVDLTKQPIPVK